MVSPLRRVGIWGAVGLVVLGAGVTAADAAPTLSPAGGATFPERAYVLTLPESARLSTANVAVTENGGPVRGLRIRSAGAARLAKMGVALAIDSSGSMRGEAYQGAFAAARAFSERRNESQPLALVTFGSEIDVPMRFTSDPYKIDAVLAKPGEPRGGTHLYDGAMRAVSLVKESGLPGGFVVILSDGTDHGSKSSGAEVVAAARAARVRLYTIGLRSPSFDAATLGELAARTNGRYSEVSSPDELNAIYTELGAELSNAHLVTYRSLVGPRRSVEVAVDVPGQGVASSSYVSPRLTPQGLDGRPGPSRESKLARALGIGIVASLVGLTALLLLRRRRESARDRVTSYVAAATRPERVGITERLTAGTQHSLGKTEWWAGLARDLDLAGVERTPGQIVAIAAAAAIGVSLLAVPTTGHLLVVPVVLAAIPLCLRSWLHSRIERQRTLFGDQLADHLAVVGGAMRAGHTLPAALAAVLDDAPEPSHREFARAVADERLGAPMEEALESVAERMRSRDVEQVALLARLQREVGANAAEMLDRVVDTIRERQELRRTVRTLTAQGRASRWVLTALPAAVLLFLTATNRGYIDPLFTTGLGNVLLAVAAGMVAAGSLVIKRIVEFKI